MIEKESIKNYFLFKSYKGFKTRDPSVMKQKVSRGQLNKTENDSEKEKTLARGVPPVRFEFLNGEEQSLPAPESCGGRRWRSTARQGDRAVPE